MTEIEILPLVPDDIPQAVECIQTVFADDPYFRWMFDPSKYNVQRNAASLTAHFLHGLHCNAPIYVAKTTTYSPHLPQKQSIQTLESVPSTSTTSSIESSRVVGVAWWHPPHSSSPSTTFPDWLLSLRQLFANIRFFGRGGLNLPRYRQWKTLQSKTHSHIWTDPRGYYFCNVIAVRAETRGQGVGRRLVEVVTQRADAEGMPCYLESSKGMPNLLIYQKLGFEEVSEIECVDGKDAVTLYCMIRPPMKHE